MFKKTESTRLGEILINKGLITPEQLIIATREQTKRKHLLKSADGTQTKATLIGEILVELGFIDQLELKRGLNWQQRLRHVSIAMALCAPFMVFAPTSATAQTTSSSSSSAAASTSKSFAPTTIQAENYSAMTGIVVKEITTDVGGGQNVGNINTGEGMAYNNVDVVIPKTSTYKITYRIATPNTGTSLTLSEAGTASIYDTLIIPKTGGWQTWTTVERMVMLPAGKHNFSINAIVGGFNINWFKIEAVPTPMPLTIQAENYSTMAGVVKEATTDVAGGQNVGNINTGEWMSYTNTDVVIPATANYKISYRVATSNAGTSFTLSEAGTSIVYDTVPVPKTGGWQTWATVERTVSLPAGVHNFTITAVVGGFNINWFKIENISTQNSSASSVNSSTASTPSAQSSSAQSKATSSAASSAPAVASNTSSSASSASNHVAGSVALSWAPPVKRENGNFLDITEVGGYELRYKVVGAANYTYITIKDAWTNQYNFSWLEGEYIFQIAAFDKNGNYSSFANIAPR